MDKQRIARELAALAEELNEGKSRMAARGLSVPFTTAVRMAKDHLKRHKIDSASVKESEIETGPDGIDLVLTFDDGEDISYLTIALKAGRDSWIE